MMGALLLLGLVLSGMSMGREISPTSFTFLVEKSQFQLEMSTTAVRISLQATIDIDQSKIEEYFDSMKSIIVQYKALPYLAVGTKLAIKYRSALHPGENYLANAKDLFQHIYTFVDTDKEEAIQSNCSLKFSFFDPSIFIEGQNLLQFKIEDLFGPITEDEVKKDAVKLMAIENFIVTFNSVANTWYDQIYSIISVMDIIDELKFPEAMRGRLETASCLKGSRIEYEKINVISSTAAKTGLNIELDVGVPTATKDMIHLMPVPYGGVALQGEANGALFAKEVGSYEIKLLNCSTDLIYIHEKAPSCRVLPLAEDCREGLKADDIERIIKYCPMDYITPPMAVRLLDDGILIMGNGLTVTNKGKVIYQHPPYIVYSNSEVKIINGEYELIFPALTTPETVNIVSTRLTMIQIVQMQNKAYWDANFYQLDMGEHLDLLALIIELLMAPLVLISICIGVKNKMSRVKEAKHLSKKLRKRNQRETRALLRESRF
jgi:hypothetical protein